MSIERFTGMGAVLALVALAGAGCASSAERGDGEGGEAGELPASGASGSGARAGGGGSNAGSGGRQTGAGGEAQAGTSGRLGGGGAPAAGAAGNGGGNGGRSEGGRSGAGADGGAAGTGSSGAGAGGTDAGGTGSGGTAQGGAGEGAGGADSGPCDTPALSLPVLREWAMEVLGGTEFGGGEEIVRRFDAPVRVSMMSGTDAHGALLEDVVGTLGGVLDDSGMSVGMAADQDDSAQMLVWFTPYDSFPDVAADYGFTSYPDNWGQFYLYWDTEQALTRAYVLLASDLLTGADLVHFTFEEVTQAFGPASDSSLVEDSIFYANGADGGNAQGLHCYDEALLQLLYAHLEPADDTAAVASAFDAYWDVR
jgi:hypothetical protein